MISEHQLDDILSESCDACTIGVDIRIGHHRCMAGSLHFSRAVFDEGYVYAAYSAGAEWIEVGASHKVGTKSCPKCLRTNLRIVSPSQIANA